MAIFGAILLRCLVRLICQRCARFDYIRVSNLLGLVFQNKNKNLNLGFVNSEMSCENVLSSVSFVAFVAPERLLSTVSLHVLLQVTGRGASVVALVTLVWLFSCVIPHHVLF